LAPEDGIRTRSAATLVICASTLVSQWAMELAKHAPGLKVLIYHGPSRKSIQHRELLFADVVVTSYAMLRFMANVMDAIDWHRVIMDGTGFCSVTHTLDRNNTRLDVVLLLGLRRIAVPQGPQHHGNQAVCTHVVKTSLVCHRDAVHLR
jgi:hypothetical protein